MLYGYVWASPLIESSEEELWEQREMLLDYGVESANIYEEIDSFRAAKRDDFDKTLERLDEGDVLVVSEFCILFRSIRELVFEALRLHKKGVELVSLKDGIDTREMGSFFWDTCRALEDTQKGIYRHLHREGQSRAKAAGKMGRPKADEGLVNKALEMYESGHTVREISEVTGLSPATVHRRIKEKGVSRPVLTKKDER